MADTLLSLYDVSAELGMSPSAIKKRVASLNLPVERGARGKLLFNPTAYAMLCRADELLKAGQGFEECRRQLGLEGAPAVMLEDEGAASDTLELIVGVAEPKAMPETLQTDAADRDVTEPEGPPSETGTAAPEVEAPMLVVAMATAEEETLVFTPPARVAHEGALPAPVFIQLGRRKPSESVRARMIDHQPTPTPMPASIAAAAERLERSTAVAQPPVALPAPAPAIVEPDLMPRLDAALKLIEDKDKQNNVLQSKLMVAYDEMTKLSATAAAFQERSLNLQHEVQKLQGEIRLLTAPPEIKPWWKFWG